MPLQLVSPPTEEPVTLEDLAQHVRQDNVDDDDYLEALIPAARELIEQSTGRAFIDQTWKLTLRDFPISGLPRHPDSTPAAKTTSGAALARMSSKNARADVASLASMKAADNEERDHAVDEFLRSRRSDRHKSLH